MLGGSESVTTITLPRLVGTRQAADHIVEETALEHGSDEVTILARAVSSAAPSFADELLKQLRTRGIRRVSVVGSPDRLFAYLSESATRFGDVVVERRSSET